MAFERSAGIILHPTSLPGPYGIGELGSEARQWIDWLASAGQTLWQVLPLGPTGYGDSPYQCFSAFAGNPYLISLEALLQGGLLTDSDLDQAPTFQEAHVDFATLIPWKLVLLSQAHQTFTTQGTAAQQRAFNTFKQEHALWLNDYALFMALKDAFEGQVWNTWPKALRDRDATELAVWRDKLASDIDKHMFWQHLFFEQWLSLKAYANEQGIKIIGDVPIFVAFDSADVWSNQELFFLDDQGNPSVIAGVPPDYFSPTGQRWGNPLYRWMKMRENNYAWWVARFKAMLTQVDIVRIDHFRGFSAYWEIQASEETAVKGRWCHGPDQALFDAFRRELGANLPIIAEDLGVITPDVEALRDRNNLPGMKILQFAFAGGASDPYLPHNHIANSVVYTGTHDNDTTLGWYKQAPEEEQDYVRRYLARDGNDIAGDFIRLAYSSPAVLALSTLQDVLRLDSEARMNTPGRASGNWSWRFTMEQLADWIAPSLKDMALCYGRFQADEVVDTPYRQGGLEPSPPEDLRVT